MANDLTIEGLQQRLAQAADNERKYRTLIETMGQGFVEAEIVRDEAGRAVDVRYLQANPAFERLTGLAAADAIGRRMSEIAGPLEPSWLHVIDRVATTGQPERREEYAAAYGRWYQAFLYPTEADGYFAFYEDITGRKQAEFALRDNEERQAFLLKLTDALRPVVDAVEIMGITAGLLGHYLATGRVGYGEVDEAGTTLTITRDWTDGLMPSAVGTHRFADFGEDMNAAFLRGETVVLEDALQAFDDPGTLRHYGDTGALRATLSVPLAKQGRVVAGMYVQQSTPRRWSDAEIRLVSEVAGRTWAAVERARAEAALRANEERQAFLLRLSDALRPLTEPLAVQQATVRMLGARLNVDRCYYAEFDWPRDVLHINTEYVRSPSFSVVGDHPISAFQGLLQFSHDGEPLVCDEIAAHPLFKSEIAAYRARQTDGFILMPQVKQGVMVACTVVSMSTPRAWSSEEVELVREVTDRTWDASQRIRAENAMRESEERFQQFADASAGALWIRNADTLKMEYVSAAIMTTYGVDAETFLNGVETWASSIVPEDRDIALAHLDRARRGEAVVHEFRIQRASDKAFRWIRDTDFPLYDSRGRVERIGGIAEDVTDAKLAVEHQGVLLAELQHRVRNIMAVLRSITTRTAASADSVASYAELMAGRLDTFARVQALLTRSANAGVGVETIVADELNALAHHEGQLDLSGPAVILSPKAAETMTLAVHELTTNAMKYGALSVPEGVVSVRWRVIERRNVPWLSFDWTETGAPPSDRPRRKGFGSELIEGQIPYELNGRGHITVGPGGAECHLEFPLKEGASILETGAPQRATVFGGAIDMTGQADLSGQRILVVEDDYYLATDATRAIEGAGARVLGPYPTEEAAREGLAEASPTCALLDINLRGGRSFNLAHEFMEKGTPFVFITGYDQDIIPEEFAAITRLQKPVEFRQIVAALGNTLGVPS